MLPREKFVIIKPKADFSYEARNFDIRGAVEHYVVFNDQSDEIVSLNDFKQYLNCKLDEAKVNC